MHLKLEWLLPGNIFSQTVLHFKYTDMNLPALDSLKSEQGWQSRSGRVFVLISPQALFPSPYCLSASSVQKIHGARGACELGCKANWSRWWNIWNQASWPQTCAEAFVASLCLLTPLCLSHSLSLSGNSLLTRMGLPWWLAKRANTNLSGKDGVV